MITKRYKEYKINFKLFKQDLDINYVYAWENLEKIGRQRNIIKSGMFENGEILMMRSKEIDSLIKEELDRDKDSLIRRVK